MREIKYRAWSEIMIYTELAITLDGKLLYWDDTSLQWIDNKSEYNLMQYTGLKDKNGKEIYEGDIIGADGLESFCKQEVYWEQEYARWSINGDAFRSPEYIAKTSVVIGNIYEHHHLLEVQHG